MIRHVGIAGLFLALGIGLTYPLVTNFATAIPGTSKDTDVASFVWNLWWTRHAVLDLHTNPLQTDYVFYPFTVDLRLHTYALLYGLMSIPFQYWLGVIGAFNLLMFLTVALNGYMTYQLARYALDRSGPALVAAALVALNPALAFHLRVGRPSFASIWPAALALLCLARLAEVQRWRNAVGLGLALLAALLIDFQILLFTALWLIIYATYLAVRRPAVLLHWRFVGGSLLALAIAGIPFLMIFYPVLVTARAHGYPVPTARDTLVYSLRVWDFITPWFVRMFFGVALPVAVVVTLVTPHKQPRWVFWLTGGIAFLVLSLGVALQPTSFPLPFAALRMLPGLAQFRTPYRFSIPAVLGLALAAGGAVAYWQARLVPAQWRSILTLAMMGLILLDARAAVPFAVQTYPDEAIYHRIARQPDDFVVLEVPLGVRSGIDVFGHGETLQFYQTIHEKRMINGMIARVPQSVFEYYRASPALRVLAGEPAPDGVDVNTDFAIRLRELRVGYVIVHPSMLEPDILEQIGAMVARRPELTLVEVTPDVHVYRVAESEPEP